MPVYQIQLEDGRKLRVDADNEQAALAGVEQFNGGSAPQEKDTGFLGAVRQGAAGVVGGIGETAEQYLGKSGFSDAMKGAGDAIRPANYDPASVISKEKGFTPSELPRALAESVPQLGASIAAAKLGSRVHPVVGALAGAAAYMGMTRGDEAKKSAEARTGVPGAEPTAEDRQRALIYGVPEAALNAAAVGRFMPGSGKVAATGARGAAESVKQAAITAGTEGVANTGQDLVQQVGRTIGTEGGVQVDPYSLANSAVVGTAAGGALSTPKLARDTSTAIRERETGSAANRAASTEVANRIVQAAGDGDFNTKDAAKAVSDVTSDLHTELKTAISQARSDGSMPAQDRTVDNMLTRVASGEKLNKNDFQALSAVPDNVKSIAQQVSMLSKLKERNLGTKENFKGGMSARMDRGVRAIVNPTGALIGAGLGYAGLASNAALMGTAGPASLGAIFGGYGLSRLMDAQTGARNPVKRFTDKFADGNAPSEPLARPVAPPSDEPLTTGPWNSPPMPSVGAFGKGPRPPEPGPQPWGPWNMPPAPQVGAFGKGFRAPDPAPAPEATTSAKTDILLDEGMGRIAQGIGKERQKQVTTAEAALRKLAKKDKANGTALDIPAFLTARQKVEEATPAPKEPETPTFNGDLKAIGAKMKMRQKMDAQAEKEAAKSAKVTATKAKVAVAEEKPVAKAPTAAPEEAPAPKPKASAYVPDAEKTSHFKSKPGDERFPYHDKYDLTPKAAAKAIADQWEAEGKPFWRGREAFEQGVSSKIALKHKLVEAIADANPTFNNDKLKSQLLTISSFEDAVAYREHLLKLAKTNKAKGRLVTAMSDEALSGIWKKPKAKKK
jgi:hypothetical protein